MSVLTWDVLQVSRLEREKTQEVKAEHHRATLAITDLKNKLHEEKQKELAISRESLLRQHEMELMRVIKIKDGEIHRLNGLVLMLRDGSTDKVISCLSVCHLSVCMFTCLKSSLIHPGPVSSDTVSPGPASQSPASSCLAMVRLPVVQGRNALMMESEEAKRSWEAERCRLQQEVQELRGAKRSADEAVALAQQACQARAAELRSAHHQHHEDLNRTRKECEREIRRLV